MAFLSRLTKVAARRHRKTLKKAERRRVPGTWCSRPEVPEKQDLFTVAAEKSMTLVGFAAFLDPPKEGVLSVLNRSNRTVSP